MCESVLITGGTGLLGKEFIKSFLSSGYRVIYISHSAQKIKQINDAFKRYQHDGLLDGILVNLVDADAIQIINEYLQERKISVNYLINNARSLDHVMVKDYREIESEKWLGEYTLDVIVPYKLTMLLTKEENVNNLKAVVNISSMYGLLPYNDYLCEGSKAIAINYGVCKAALLQLTRELAIRLAPQGVRVNAISYGGVSGRADEAFKQRYAQLCPEGKMLDPVEVAGHAVYLCSDQSLGMTGHNLVVDGGFSVW